MALKSMVGGELKGIKNGISKRGAESENFLYQSNSHLALDVSPIEPIQQGQWASLPHELLFDIIRRVEQSEKSWPARAVVVFCASICKSWRSATKEIIKTLPQCGRTTFPISLKQPGPRDSPCQCFIKRNRRTSTFLMYLQQWNNGSKLLLVANRIRRSNFVVSLAGDDFSLASNKYVCKLRWEEHHNGWGPDFIGHFRVETVRNFDLVAVVDRSHDVSPAVKPWPILHVGKPVLKTDTNWWFCGKSGNVISS